MVSGFEDAANNFARGHYTLGKNHIDYTINRIRKCADMCECLEGFFIFNSYGGGTGAGFSALLLERLNVEFTKDATFQTAIYPGELLSTATVEPYNSLLCTTALVNNLDLCNIFDNESLYKICSVDLDIPRPTYNNLNRVISQIVSSLTVSVRFESYLNAELSQMVTNLVPYPRIHFPVFTHSPLTSSKKATHQPFTISELTRAAFDVSNQLVRCDLSEGRYICCCLQYRGKVTPREVNDALYEIKRRTDIKFVEWCPTSFKLGLNCHPPAFIPRSEIADTSKSLTVLSNSTAIAQKFRSLSRKFDLLFGKRSFLYWYIGEGMEEAEFFNCRDEMTMLYTDYEELGTEDDSNEKAMIDGHGDEVEGVVEEYPQETDVEEDEVVTDAVNELEEEKTENSDSEKSKQHIENNED